MDINAAARRCCPVIQSHRADRAGFVLGAGTAHPPIGGADQPVKLGGSAHCDPDPSRRN